MIFAASAAATLTGSDDLVQAALKTVESRYPVVSRISAGKASEAAVNGMLWQVDPSGNSFLFSAKDEKSASGQVSPGLVVRLVDGVPTILAVFAGTDAYQREFVPGDLLLKIGDEVTVGKNLHQLEALLAGPAGSTVRMVAYRRSGKRFLDVPVKREVVAPAAHAWPVGRNIGYVTVNQLDKSGTELLKAKLEEMLKQDLIGLVLDLRSTAGGTVDDALAAAGLFLETGKPVVQVQTRDAAPVTRSTDKSAAPTMHMVVICDEGTCGAAEILAAALQDDKRAVVIGEKTHGQASAQALVDLDGGWRMQLTSELYLSPSGRDLSGEGVKPDIAMKAEVLAPDVMAKFRQEFVKFCEGLPATGSTSPTASVTSTGAETSTTSTESSASTTGTPGELDEDHPEADEETGPDGKPKLKTSDGILEEYRLVKRHDTVLVRAINILISANIFFEYGQRQK
jgi:carboxyl-terminal processing protease